MNSGFVNRSGDWSAGSGVLVIRPQAAAAEEEIYPLQVETVNLLSSLDTVPVTSCRVPMFGPSQSAHRELYTGRLTYTVQ